MALDLSFLRSRPVLKRLAAVTATCAAAGLLYGLLAPKWYVSVLSVVPSKQQKSGGLSSLLGGAELGGLAAGLAESMGGSADVARIAAVLQSTSVSDAVIEKFDLRSRYREKYQENAREELWRHCSVRSLPKPNLVQLACEDKDPQFVRELLSYFAEYGNQVFRRVSVSSASEEVRFLERRVNELRQAAAESAARMQAFQEQHQLIDLETQSKAVVSALAALNSQRISKQLELKYLRTFSSQDEASTQALESQLSVMDDKIRDLEDLPPPLPSASKHPRPGRENGLFPAALAVPKLRAEYEGLYRDRKVSEATLVFALERLESAKADEARDVSTFQVLDPPALPTRHARPKRATVTLLSALAGLAAAVAYEWIRRGGLRPFLTGSVSGSDATAASDRDSPPRVA